MFDNFSTYQSVKVLTANASLPTFQPNHEHASKFRSTDATLIDEYSQKSNSNFKLNISLTSKLRSSYSNCIWDASAQCSGSDMGHVFQWNHFTLVHYIGAGLILGSRGNGGNHLANRLKPHRQRRLNYWKAIGNRDGFWSDPGR